MYTTISDKACMYVRVCASYGRNAFDFNFNGHRSSFHSAEATEATATNEKKNPLTNLNTGRALCPIQLPDCLFITSEMMRSAVRERTHTFYFIFFFLFAQSSACERARTIVNSKELFNFVNNFFFRCFFYFLLLAAAVP